MLCVLLNLRQVCVCGLKTHLEIPPLFKDSDHGFVDVSDEFVSL